MEVIMCREKHAVDKAEQWFIKAEKGGRDSERIDILKRQSLVRGSAVVAVNGYLFFCLSRRSSA
jgi:hypothetical protein